jgi:PPM family protein phosphatase
MRIAIEALTDVGLVRELNEDSYRVIPERQAIVVCDGMGGHAAGEVASATAADTIADWLKDGSLAVAGPLVPSLGADWPPEAVQLAAAVRLANRRLYNEAARSHKLRGMGTTVAAVLFRPGSVITAHVGDSRVYRITPQRIEQLTTDHSWVAELLESGHVRPEDVQHFADKNVITRALGTRPGVQVDLGIHAVQAGDIYLICSDGLCGYVDDAEIHRRVRDHAPDLKAAAVALIAAASEAGGLDNSTVALVRIDDVGSGEPLSGESVTLAEESEADLAQLDKILTGRYGEAGEAAEEHTDTAPASPAAAAPVTSAGSRSWQWIVLVALLGALAVIMLWPRARRENAEHSVAPGTEEAAETVAAMPKDSLALLFLAAGRADRAAVVYLDKIRQGTLRDLEFGLLVEPGVHSLTVIDARGDTLLQRGFTLKPRDTLDLVVR